jgi:hypothetical protein
MALHDMQNSVAIGRMVVGLYFFSLGREDITSSLFTRRTPATAGKAFVT